MMMMMITHLNAVDYFQKYRKDVTKETRGIYDLLYTNQHILKETET